MSTGDGGRSRFGDFELDSVAGKLFRDGLPVKIQPQPLQILAVLVERPGELVSREELRTRVWGASTYVEFDQGLNYCIRQIRMALGDDASRPVYIETLPKQGYRLIALVERGRGSEVARESGEVEAPVPAEEPRVPAAAGSPAIHPDAIHPDSAARRARPNLIAAVLILSALGAAGGWWTVARRVRSLDDLKAVRLTKLTYFPGQETDPAFSPDGRSVAFSWDGEHGDNRDIYVMTVGSQTPVRLTTDPAVDISPMWSPDGSQIAFFRVTPIAKGKLMVIPAGGGQERVIREIGLSENVQRALRPILTWSPDGKALIYAAEDNELGRASLYTTDLQGSAARRLITSDEGTSGATEPAISRDGKWLAYAVADGPLQARLFVRALESGLQVSGETIRVSEGSGTFLASPVWAPDSKHLFYSQNTSVFEWEPRRSPKRMYIGPRLAGMSASWGPDQSLRIVTADSDHVELRMLPLRSDGLSASGNPAPFAPSTTMESHPQFSPDGKSITFLGARSGAPEIWVSDGSGRNLRQLTHLNATVMGYPRWSPDGHRIAFHAWLDNKPRVFTVDIERPPSSTAGGDAVKQITDPALGLVSPTWSVDGKYIYANTLGGETRTFRIPAEGGSPEYLFEGGGGRVTPDGRYLVFFKTGRLGIFRRSLEGDPATNPEEKLVDDYRPPGADLNPVADGVYYIGWNGPGKSRAIQFYSYAKRKSQIVFVLPGPLSDTPGLGIAPDRSRAMYSQLTGTGTDLTLIEFQ